jgi:hypothetical protein
MTNDGALSDLRQPDDALPPRVPSQVRDLTIPLLVCLETSCFSSRKHDWLPFGGLLVNLSMLHHVSVISLQRSLVRGGSGDLALASV